MRFGLMKTMYIFFDIDKVLVYTNYVLQEGFQSFLVKIKKKSLSLFHLNMKFLSKRVECFKIVLSQ